MRRTLIIVVIISSLHAFSQTPAQAVGLGKLFKELFSSSGSKSASEAGQAAVRQADEGVTAPKSEANDPVLEAGQFLAEEAAGDVIKDSFNARSDDERFVPDRY